MTINGLGGEFALIDRIAAMRPASTEGSAVVVGIGDDAAVLGCAPDTSILVTTDLLIEDVHFRRTYGDPYSLGVKAAAVNLSDIAAMGGTPTAAFISLGLPTGTEVAYLDEIYRGLSETFSRFGATIAGGDTNVTPDKIVINVVQMGTAVMGQEILRSTAQPGDVVIVTGELGAAAAGFALLEAVGRADAEVLSPDAVRAQLRPVPRVAEAQAAAATGGITAMMDLSDGLMGDLAKLCRASGVGAIVWADTLSVAPAASAVAEHLSADALHWALRGGEDYELLITSSPLHARKVVDALRGCGLEAAIVGEIVVGKDVKLFDSSGLEAASGAGWDHFANV